VNKNKLPVDFYQRQDVLQISRELLGKVLCTRLNDGSQDKPITTAGIIIETEAYRAPEDKASHAYNARRTKRTETMFAAGGVAYVYLCYGIHSLFNIVTGPKDTPHAVLIRSIHPIKGIPHMLKRRKQTILKANLASGPGVLCSALGINTVHDRSDLTGTAIWVEDHGYDIRSKNIITTPRIGISYAEEYVDLPWRFVLKNIAECL
jgi:DNA-3-methyladenine glycosylase